jgi:hypothetical protein
MRRNSTRISVAAWSLTGVLFSGCAESPPDLARAPRAENPELGIAIAAVHPPFVVTRNEGAVFELRAPGEAGDATLFLETTAEMGGGINLVAEAEGMREWFEQQPEGQYFGNLELGTPLGPAFTSRGSYALEGTIVEEIRVFAIHPTGNRLLRMTYRYSPGEGKERLQQLAEILGEIEGVWPADQEASSEAPGS